MIETEKPVFVHLLPPCNHRCDAGEDIQTWMQLVAAGDYLGAWKSLVENNPLPAIMGRVCYHPCESDCNRVLIDQPLNIHAVERFLGDEAIKHGWQFDKPTTDTGKRVLIVGAGPSGLSAAYHLRRLGHRVTIYEAGPKPGGMMRFGIPKYRLPRNILDAEIARIEALGVDIKLNTKVDDLAAVRKQECFDAVFLAVGAHLAKRAYIPAQDAGKILDALTLLRSVESGVTPALGRRVLVYGGGNTALDAARTAKRLGASETLIVYRRTRDKMPAEEFEVNEAIEEGVQFKWLSTIHAGGENSFTIEKMSLDETGFPQPTGEFETIDADAVILALGQDVDLSFLKRMEDLTVECGAIKVNNHMMTGSPGVFAGGDMASPSRAGLHPAADFQSASPGGDANPGNPRTVTFAVGHGKAAARNIDAFLRGEIYEKGPTREIATFDRLNPGLYPHLSRTVEPVAIGPEQRLSSFDEVIAGLDETKAVFEARRCLSCGNCHECDNCYKVCPGDAIEKLGAGRGYRFNYDNCDGCGLCAEECACGAIRMQVN